MVSLVSGFDDAVVEVKLDVVFEFFVAALASVDEEVGVVGTGVVELGETVDASLLFATFVGRAAVELGFEVEITGVGVAVVDGVAVVVKADVVA